MTRCALAGIVFARGEDPDALLTAFALAQRDRGARVSGFVQVGRDTPDCGCKETHVLDLETGTRRPILQNLGSGSKGCRADAAAIAEISQWIIRALNGAPDLLVINRFGKLETEGRGMIEEIAAAAGSGIPTLIGVSDRYLPQWRDFAGDAAEELPCRREALEGWWADIGFRTHALPQGTTSSSRGAGEPGIQGHDDGY